MKRLALLLSVISALVAALSFAGSSLVVMSTRPGPRLTGVFLLCIGVVAVLGAFTVWMVPGARWPLIRWLCALVPAALALLSGVTMVQAPHWLFLSVFAYGAAIAAFLIAPEIASWRRRAEGIVGP